MCSMNFLRKSEWESLAQFVCAVSVAVSSPYGYLDQSNLLGVSILSIREFRKYL